VIELERDIRDRRKEIKEDKDKLKEAEEKFVSLKAESQLLEENIETLK
jgi:hypothetical protein